MNDYRTISIDPELHNKVRIAAALRGVTIKEFTEDALRDKLNKTLVDSGVTYQTKEATK